MGIRRKGVSAPQDNQLGKPQRFRIHADSVVPEGVPCADRARYCANRSEVARRAKRVPQSLARAVNALDEPHVSAADVGPNGLGTELLADLEQPRRDLCQRLVPRDARKASAALRASAAHGIEQALWRLCVCDVILELVAQRATREGMASVALQLDGSAILDRDDPTA